jgi:hypothetical protein
MNIAVEVANIPDRHSLLCSSSRDNPITRAIERQPEHVEADRDVSD